MAKIYLVRHGQASFGAADYDQLSPLGAQQCELLGQHWRAMGLRFDAVWMGSLKRHRQSMEAIAAGLGKSPADVEEMPATMEELINAIAVLAEVSGLAAKGEQLGEPKPGETPATTSTPSTDSSPTS